MATRWVPAQSPALRWDGLRRRPWQGPPREAKVHGLSSPRPEAVPSSVVLGCWGRARPGAQPLPLPTQASVSPSAPWDLAPLQGIQARMLLPAVLCSKRTEQGQGPEPAGQAVGVTENQGPGRFLSALPALRGSVRCLMVQRGCWVSALASPFPEQENKGVSEAS